MSVAKKNDKVDAKISRRFLHPRFKEECSLAMEAGKLKYGDFNFMKGHTILQLLDALERHLDLYKWGEDLDKDCSERLGRPVTHLGNMAACINMLLAQDDAGTLKDDRYHIDKVDRYEGN